MLGIDLIRNPDLFKFNIFDMVMVDPEILEVIDNLVRVSIKKNMF